MTLNEKIKMLRNSKGISQEEASNQIGIAVSSLRNYEKDRFPEIDQLKRIKNFYNVSYDYLLDDTCNTKENKNIKIGRSIGISDNSIEILKKISTDKKSLVLDSILQTLYNDNKLSNLESYFDITYISDTILNASCNCVNKILKHKEIKHLSKDYIKDFQFFLDYTDRIHYNKEHCYFNYLTQNETYNKFRESVYYLVYNDILEDKEYVIKDFQNYKEVRNMFNEYKKYLLVQHFDNTEESLKKLYNTYIKIRNKK